MPTADVHHRKAELCWKLAKQLYAEGRDEFLCMNLIFYAAAHLIEEALAIHHKHPSAQPRGVPHADREVQLRRHLVGKQLLESDIADLYTELFSIRHTFAEEGIQNRSFIEHYMKLGRPLVERLETLVKQQKPAF
jgi:hypothetical protein